MAYDDLLQLVKNRRSIRRFKPDPIPGEMIEKIIEVARWAPSGFNMQPWEFVIVQKPELRKKIVEIVGEYWKQAKPMETARESWQGRLWQLNGVVDSNMDYTTAPVYIILFGDTRTQEGQPMAQRYSPDRANNIFNSTLAGAFLYMHLAATTIGLASQWVSAIAMPYAQCMIKPLLGIPRELMPYDMMALGYPAMKPSDKYMRDPKKMVHYDDCGIEDFRTDGEVREHVKKARSWVIGHLQRKAND